MTKTNHISFFVLQLRNAINCPSYSDIYGEYKGINTKAGQNLDLAFSKCQQWSNKLKSQPAAAATATVDEPAQSRTHKVYDSMKNFLQRKLFAQPSQRERLQSEEEEEPTSDYDEVCKPLESPKVLRTLLTFLSFLSLAGSSRLLVPS